jgi:dTDP-4-dehydrorhamnose reductase
MRIAVIGRSGQVAQSLRSLGRARGLYVISAGRPDVDLSAPETIVSFLERTNPDLVVNAAAYTAVDKAESEPDAAFRVNAAGAAHVAAACEKANVPLVHLSTDFVFDGNKRCPYLETDRVAPISVYGASKAAGEEAVRAACGRHVILRTSWVYAPVGTNFVRTMLRLGAERSELGVVADQRGTPTDAREIAGAILDIAPRLRTAPADIWGTYHLTGSYETTWHKFAEEIFRQAALRGAKVPRLKAISTAEYPTPARRPAYSVLDNGKFIATFGLALPDWRASLAGCLDELLPARIEEHVA